MLVKTAKIAIAVAGKEIILSGIVAGFEVFELYPIISYRSYKVSNQGLQSVEFDQAYNFCNGLTPSLGLAVWKGVDASEDIKYLTTTWGESYTALNNENNVKCHKHKDKDLDDCDDKLIWRQNKNGPCELFEADAGHNNM